MAMYKAISVRAADELEKGDFLTAPTLFRYGPRMMLLFGIAFSILAVGAGMWRIHEGRRTEYERFFVASAATAEAAKETLGQLLARLDHAAAHIDTLQNAPSQQMQIVGLLEGLGSHGVAFAKSGGVVASASGSPEGTAIAEVAMRDRLARQLPRGGQAILPAVRSPLDGEILVPVVQRMWRPGPVEAVVFLLDEQALSGVVRKEFRHEGGWLHIEDGSGHEVLSLLLPSERPGAAGKPRDKLLTPEQALQGPLDYDSQRLLVASASQTAGQPRVSVGLTEAAALDGVHKKIVSTWVIVSLIVPVIGAMALISLALRKFSRVEAYLRRLARFDVLTGLPNRRSFLILLREAVARACSKKDQTLALMFVDIDNFKYVNDSFGHTVGDGLLKHVGLVLSEVAGEGNVVCRLGGDEFTILVAPVDDAAAALSTGYRILERLKELVRIDGIELRCRASIGIALMTQSVRTQEDLLRYADTALHRAKGQGKNCCVVFNDVMAAQAQAEAQIMHDLECGIPADELFLVYQPKFELCSGALVGHEALVRWQHPTRGLVHPGDFIALAEASGLIRDLGNWVLERAVRQIGQWHAQGQGWHSVAVNVSALQMRDRDFLERVALALERYQVQGSLLQVEITESSLVDDIEQVKALVRGLRRLGVRVAVDDFGTGYSSLWALQQFQLDIVKVDRSFVSLIRTTQGEAICRAIITLGHAMGMKVVGEGVETRAQAATLARLGCDEGQGFYFAKPLGADIVQHTLPAEGFGACLVLPSTAAADASESQRCSSENAQA